MSSSTHAYVTCIARATSAHVAAPRSPTILYTTNSLPLTHHLNSFSINTKNRKTNLAAPKMSSSDNSFSAGEAKGQAQVKTEQVLDAIKGKAEEAKDTVVDAVEATKEAAEDGKAKTDGSLESTGAQIKGTVEGAAEAVKNAFTKDDK